MTRENVPRGVAGNAPGRTNPGGNLRTGGSYPPPLAALTADESAQRGPVPRCLLSAVPRTGARCLSTPGAGPVGRCPYIGAGGTCTRGPLSGGPLDRGQLDRGALHRGPPLRSPRARLPGPGARGTPRTGRARCRPFIGAGGTCTGGTPPGPAYRARHRGPLDPGPAYRGHLYRGPPPGGTPPGGSCGETDMRDIPSHVRPVLLYEPMSYCIPTCPAMSGYVPLCPTMYYYVPYVPLCTDVS